MKLFVSSTSPYARIARIALAEKGVGGVDIKSVDPWSDPADLLAANPAGRIPALVLNDGRVLTESMLIVYWAEQLSASPSLLGQDATGVLSLTGTGMGVIEAAAATIIGRRGMGPDFDKTPVAAKRRRTLQSGFAKLEAELTEPLTLTANGAPTLAGIVAVVALDYFHLRFAGQPLPPIPKIEALHKKLDARPAFASSRPHA